MEQNSPYRSYSTAHEEKDPENPSLRNLSSYKMQRRETTPSPVTTAAPPQVKKKRLLFPLVSFVFDWRLIP